MVPIPRQHKTIEIECPFQRNTLCSTAGLASTRAHLLAVQTDSTASGAPPATFHSFTFPS
eukprot:852941-Amphidinium_carterae.1